MTLSSKKYLVKQSIKKYHISIRTACELFKISRTAYYYTKKNNGDRELIMNLLHLAYQYPKNGYWKIYYLLLDKNFIVNHKHVYRLYKAFGLTLKK